MDAHALSEMFSCEAVNRKGKAKRIVRQRKSKYLDKPRPRGAHFVDYEKPVFNERMNRKIGPYYEHELADVSDGDADDENGEYVPIELANGEIGKILFSNPDDDDKSIELYYDTEVGGDFKGLSDALVANSFEIGTKDHRKRFKRILDWQIPHEEELRMQCPLLNTIIPLFL